MEAACVDEALSRGAAWLSCPHGGTVTLTRDRTIELLSRTQLFAGVDPEGLSRIADRVRELDVPVDRVIARQGEIGTGFFVIAEGMVRVVRDGDLLAELGPGDFFGELSVLDGKPRNAQVVSTEPTVCLALATWDFEAVVAEQPSVALAILRELAGRLRETTDAHRH
jgi:CRP/FNR family cyclic AMP-dependent transcriptional regulator